MRSQTGMRTVRETADALLTLAGGPSWRCHGRPNLGWRRMHATVAGSSVATTTAESHGNDSSCGIKQWEMATHEKD